MDIVARGFVLFNVVELFAGCGGLALGLEKAGFKPVLLNEVNKQATQTLLTNRPDWPVECQDVSTLDLSTYAHTVDLLAGGLPCQSFRYQNLRH